MHLSSRVFLPFILLNFPAESGLSRRTNLTYMMKKNLILLFLSRRTGRAGRKGTAYTFVTSEQGR